MLTTSPACSARHISSRIVRTSTRQASPSREIWPDAGLTHQAPIRSVVLVWCSILRSATTLTSDGESARQLYQHRGKTPTPAVPPTQHIYVISGVFRLFQTLAPDFSRLTWISALRIANKSKRKERKYHEWRLCTSAIGEKERSVSNRSRRRDCRDFGPSTSLHVIWM